MINSEFRSKLWRFGALGVVSNVVCYILFLAMLWAGLYYILANIVSYLFGLTISYFGNRRWAFKSSNKHRHDLVRFTAAYGIGLPTSVATIAICVRFVPPPIAQIFAVAAAATVIFVSLNAFRFGRSPTVDPRLEPSPGGQNL